MNFIEAKIVPGYQIASGKAEDPKFPNGTIKMQAPHFASRGLNIQSYFPGTINVDIAPFKYKVLKPKHHFTGIKWTERFPEEDFYFFDLIAYFDGREYIGLVYMPDPNTKTNHFHKSSILELLLPKIKHIDYHKSIKLRFKKHQIVLIS